MSKRALYAFALACAAPLCAAPALAQSNMEEAEACKAEMDAPAVTPQIGEMPEGYVECIAADELYAELLEFSAAWVACHDAGNAECLGALYDDDAVAAPAGGETLSGAEEIEQHYAEEFAGYADGESSRTALQYDNVEAHEDQAVILQRWRQVRSAPDGQTRAEGRTLQILRPGEDGAWRIWREMGNSGAPAGDEPWPESFF